ncbi:MAG: ferritin-like protein [Actinomycetota bacterium]|nr:ferritin-like protein [Actinomycetota bacterium]MDQ5807428.1 ferritin-like protein [Actinomycetota bacterium]
MSDQAPQEQEYTREQLVEMLQQASELEHALTCQYLYAAFSLRTGPTGAAPGMTPSQVTLAGHWDQQITKIAAQEMYHLMLASNLLTSIGEKPHLDRGNFPQPPKHFSQINLPSMLAAFDAATVQRFMCWEKPEQPGWWDDRCKTVAAETSDVLGFEMLAAADATYGTIGELYGHIGKALETHPEWIDPVHAAAQVTTDLVPFSPPVPAITTYEEAQRQIDVIVLEGEGTANHDSQAHFAFFHQIHDELTAGPDFTPAWPTVLNPAYDEKLAPPGSTLITAEADPVAAAVGALCNDAYLLLLRTLGRLFLPNGESDEQRQTLANAAMAFMPLVIKPLGTLLMRIPLSGPHEGLFAGPSFELPQPISLPTAEALTAWGDLHEDAARLTGRARVLTVRHGATVPDLEMVASHLETILPLFVLEQEAVL